MIISIIKIGLLASLTAMGGGIYNILKNTKQYDFETYSEGNDIYLNMSNNIEDNKIYVNTKISDYDLNRKPNLSMNREYQYINNKILEKENIKKNNKEIWQNIHICNTEIYQLNEKLACIKDINDKEKILDHLEDVKRLKDYWTNEDKQSNKL